MRAHRRVFATCFNYAVVNQVLGRIQLYQYNMPIPVAAWSIRGFESRWRPETWISRSSELCRLSGKGLCDGPFTLTDESYRVWRVWVWSTNLTEEAMAQQNCPAVTKIKVWQSSARRRKPWRISDSTVSIATHFETPHIPHYSQDRYSLSQVIYCESWSMKR
jgi:hypothetical protein